MGSKIQYICPFCSANLMQTEALFCPACARSFEKRDGIPLLCAAPIYWNPTTKGRMYESLQLARTRGWAAGLQHMVQEAGRPKHRQARRRIVLDDTRAGWMFLMEMPEHGTVLDLGCGLGTLSMHLSRFYERVVSCDLTVERVQFLKIRAEQEGHTNLEYVCAGDTPTLPFPSACFDAIVINGVLEWVPEGRDGDPRAIQQAFLGEVRRMLKDGGQIYLAIENRIGYEYFLGKPDNHSDLLYGSLLPRVLANQYSRIRRGKPYRTYTYAMGGLRRLLQKAGFPCQHYYSTVPDYRHIEQMVDLTDRSQMCMDVPLHRGQTRTSKWLLKSALYRQLAPSFGIVASPNRRRRFIDDLVDHVGQELPLRSSYSKWFVKHYLLSEKAMLICPLTNGTNGAMLRVPLSNVAVHHARRNADSTTALHAAVRIPEELKLRIPRPLVSGTYRHADYFVESLVPGISASKLENESRITNAVEAAAAFVVDLHDSTKTLTSLESEDYARLVGQHLEAVRELVDSPQHKDVLDRLNSYLRDAFVQRPLPLVWRIGDIGISNVMVDPSSGSLMGVVDWDRSEQHALPFLDMAHLLGSWLRRRHGRSAGEVLIRNLLPCTFEGEAGGLVKTYCSRLGISNDLMRPLLLAWWLQFVAGRIDFRVELDDAWMEQNVSLVCDYLATIGDDLNRVAASTVVAH